MVFDEFRSTINNKSRVGPPLTLWLHHPTIIYLNEGIK